MSFCLLYTTCANEDEAKMIARTLLDKELVACANLFPPMTSLYTWEGKMQESTEFAMILKTTETCQDKAVEVIKSVHSYDCPCVIKLPIEGGNDAFLKWLAISCKLPY